MKRNVNQKGQLCACLAAIGAIGKARQILSRVPVLYQLMPDIAENMCRLLNFIIEPAYAPLRPTFNTLAKAKPDRLQFAPSLWHLNCRVASFDVLNAKKNHHVHRYTFFYAGWSENLPLAMDFDSAFKNIRMLLASIGFYLSRDVTLVWKIIRIAKAHLAQVFIYLTVGSNHQEWLAADNCKLYIPCIYWYPRKHRTWTRAFFTTQALFLRD